jgi:RHS repeat-associated protein
MKAARVLFRALWFCAAISLLSPQPAAAKNIGADPPQCAACACATCTRPSLFQSSDTSSFISRTEGNLTDSVTVGPVKSGFGPTMSLSLVYNTYNADGSRATVDTILGYGWTHSMNIFLFSQSGSLFRYDGVGRVTRYAAGSGGTFTGQQGYFETLVKNPDGSYTITQKDKTAYNFMSIPNTPFLVNGSPVFMLTTMVDRNGNTTTFTYNASGLLSQATDTYGRKFTFTYSAGNHLTSVIDPAGRITQFTYDSTGHLLSKITDPVGSTIQYTYNSLYQVTNKTDKAGRTFNYIYSNSLPVAVYDSSNTGPATLSNPSNWSTNSTQLAIFQMRVYNASTTTNTDGRGNTWTYTYDTRGYLTNATAPDGASTTYTYDPVTLQVSKVTDADGHSTNYTYDSMGNRISKTDALGNTTTYTYEATFNMMTSMTDPRGRTTTYTYDGHGNRTQETDPLSQTRTWAYDAHGNVTSATDQNSHTTTFTYDAFGNRISATDPLGNLTTLTYDGVGNMTSRTDANGHTTSFQYDGMNRLTKVTDPALNTDQTVYDGEGNRISVTDRNGHTTTYQYDQRQRLIKTTDALGQVESYTYDGNDNRISLTDRNGHPTTYAYDVQNRMNRVTDALGDVTTMAYDGVGNVTGQTDANGHTTTTTYDSLNRRATVTDAAGETTQYQYDTGTFTGCGPGTCGATPGSNIVTGQTDANGKVTYFKYDALDRQIRVVRKVGSTADTITASDAVTSNTYDAVGNGLTMTEPDGNTTSSQYDADNRRTKITNAAGDITTTTYDGVGNVASMTAPNLNTISYTYDSLDRLTQENDSAGVVVKHTYDVVGNRLTQTDGNNNTTSFTYDALNRLINTTDPLGKSTTVQFDAVGNLIQQTDRNGNITTYAYDNINRRISMTDALSNTTQWQYDPVGNLITLTDANAHATQYVYDAVNRPSKETYADGFFRSFAYDGISNIVSRIDQNGATTTYAYNDLYFLTSRTYPSAINDTFTYDLSGRILSAQRGTWPVTFTYDGANRLLQTVQNGKIISYSYNIPGRTRAMTYPSGRVITEHTDARTRIDHIDESSSPPSIVQYTYDAGNRVITRAYRNGTSAAYTYNANNWTLNIQHAMGVTPIAGSSYTYDNEGNRQIENKLQDTTHSEAYTYDSTYRLITYKVGTVVGSTVPAPSTQTAYSLDPVGNWNSKTTDAVTQNRTHNSTNELVQIDASSLTYDHNGNVISDGSNTYSYDEENRLTQLTRNSDSAVVGQYQYDALGRRVQRIANPAGSPLTTRYFYDDARIVEDEDQFGNPLSTYVYGNFVDEVLTLDRPGHTYYYHQNAVWSAEAVTDQTGSPVERYRYDAYGTVIVTDGSFSAIPPNAWGTPHSAIANPWLFTGRQFDEEAGLYFYRARYYDAAKGRFLQRDPKEYVDGSNLYEYVKDNPINAVDPRGLEEITVACPDKCDKGNCVFTTSFTADTAADPADALKKIVKAGAKVCISHSPGRSNDPAKPPEKCCQSRPRRRAGDASGSIKITLTDGTVCKFEKNTFPQPGDPGGEAYWPPKWGTLPAACRPPVGGPGQGILKAQLTNVDVTLGEGIDVHRGFCFVTTKDIREIDIDIDLEGECYCRADGGPPGNKKPIKIKEKKP